MDIMQLGPWLFNPADFSISDATQRKELEPLLVKLLCCFAKDPGRIISRQELIDTIWQQSYVDDNAINRAISELRKALQHRLLSQSPIKTHHRKGYSLQLQAASSALDAAPINTETATAGAKTSKPVWYGIAASIAAAVAACVMYFMPQVSAPVTAADTGDDKNQAVTLTITNQQKVTWFKGIESRPLISPDKQFLAYGHSQADGSMRVLVRKLGIAAGNTLQEVALEHADKLYTVQTWQPQSRNLLLQVISKDGSDCKYQSADFSAYPQYQLTTVATCSGMIFGTAQLSADGQWLYRSKGNGGIYSSNALVAENIHTGAVQTLVAAPSAGFGVTLLALSADGSKLAYILMTESNKSEIFIYDPASREHHRIASLPKPMLLLGLEWSLDQQNLLVPGADAILQLSLADKPLKVWQLPQGITVGELSLLSANQAYISALSPGKATQGALQLIKISQPFTAEPQVSFLHNAAGSALALAISPTHSESYAFSANWTGGWQLWFSQNGENMQLTEFENNEQPVNNISWSGNGRYIAFVKQGNLYLYDMQLRQLINKREHHDIGHPVWLPDNSGLVMTRLDSDSQNLWQLDLISDNFNQLTFVAGSYPQFDDQGQLFYHRDGRFYRYVDGAKQDVELQSSEDGNFTAMWQLKNQQQYRFSMLGHIELIDRQSGEVKRTQVPYQLLGLYPDPHDDEQLYAAVFVTPELALELIQWQLDD